MKLSKLLENVEILFSEISLGEEVTGITLDTRKGCEGALYAALPSLSDPNRHGLQYVAAAKAGGAKAVLLDRDADTLGLPKILVKDVRFAEARAASNFYGSPASRMKMIGVTGTKGKTSTTHFIRAALEHAGIPTGLIGTNGVFWMGKSLETGSTTPEATALYRALDLMAKDGVRVCVMEVSSHALDVGRVAPIRFAAGAFLNLSQDHLDYFKTMENLAAAKEKLAGLSDVFYYNADDPEADRMKKAAGERGKSFSLEKLDADLVAREIKLLSGGVVFDALSDNGMRRIRISTPGRFTVQNGLAAIGCLQAVGLDMDQIAEGLAAAGGVRGRAEVVETGRPFSAMVDYAHTPESLKEILEAVRPFTEGRILLVFGCGGNRDRLKRPIMGGIASEGADLVYLTSDNPRFEEPEAILDEIEAGVDRKKARVFREADRRKAVAMAVSEAKEGDLVLVAGKGHEDYQEIRGTKHHMDDRELILDALRALPESGSPDCVPPEETTKR